LQYICCPVTSLSHKSYISFLYQWRIRSCISLLIKTRLSLRIKRISVFSVREDSLRYEFTSKLRSVSDACLGTWQPFAALRKQREMTVALSLFRVHLREREREKERANKKWKSPARGNYIIDSSGRRDEESTFLMHYRHAFGGTRDIADAQNPDCPWKRGSSPERRTSR